MQNTPFKLLNIKRRVGIYVLDLCHGYVLNEACIEGCQLSYTEKYRL